MLGLPFCWLPGYFCGPAAGAIESGQRSELSQASPCGDGLEQPPFDLFRLAEGSQSVDGHARPALSAPPFGLSQPCVPR